MVSCLAQLSTPGLARPLGARLSSASPTGVGPFLPLSVRLARPGAAASAWKRIRVDTIGQWNLGDIWRRLWTAHLDTGARGQRRPDMSPEFVRYSPEIETLDPDLDKLLDQIIAFWENKVRNSPVEEGSGRATRGAH